jgi:hypothetical protein
MKKKINVAKISIEMLPPRPPTVEIRRIIRHPDGSPASDGGFSGDELYEISNSAKANSYGSKYEIADELRRLASFFANQERPEYIDATVLVVVRRRPLPPFWKDAAAKQARRTKK